MKATLVISNYIVGFALILYIDGVSQGHLMFDTFPDVLEAKRAWGELAKGGGLNE